MRKRAVNAWNHVPPNIMTGVRVVAALVSLYATALIWITAHGDTLGRRFAVSAAGLLLTWQSCVSCGVRSTLPLIGLIVAVLVSAAAGAGAPWWEPLVVLVSLTGLLGARAPTCCVCPCKREPDCCCLCSCSLRRQGEASPKRRSCVCRLQRLPFVVRRCLEVTAGLLLLPALAASLRQFSCVPQNNVATALRCANFDRYLSGYPPKNFDAGDGVIVRYGGDANSSYAVFLGAEREIYFAGTHDLALLRDDFTITARVLEYGNISSIPACSKVRVSHGFFEPYWVIRDQIVDEVQAMLLSNASAPIHLAGFSLGGAVAPLAAMDLVCSGVIAASQVDVLSLAGPAPCSGDECLATFDALQQAGLTVVRIVNVFDIVPWMVALVFEPLHTSTVGSTQIAFTSSGQLVLTAHAGSGYLPNVRATTPGMMDACNQLRALAWLPVAATVCLWALTWLVDRLWDKREAQHPDSTLAGAQVVVGVGTVPAEDADAAVDPQSAAIAGAAAAAADSI